MTDDTVLDTTIHEPPMTAGEVEMLLFALDRSRAQFAWKCGGLDAAGLNRPYPPSAMTLGGLLKHLAVVEERYTIDFTGEAPGPPLDDAEAAADPDWAWRTAADDPPEELYGLWRRAVEHSRAAMARALAEGGLDQPAKYTTCRRRHGAQPAPHRGGPARRVRPARRPRRPAARGRRRARRGGPATVTAAARTAARPAAAAAGIHRPRAADGPPGQLWLGGPSWPG